MGAVEALMNSQQQLLQQQAQIQQAQQVPQTQLPTQIQQTQHVQQIQTSQQQSQASPTQLQASKPKISRKRPITTGGKTMPTKPPQQQPKTNNNFNPFCKLNLHRKYDVSDTLNANAICKDWNTPDYEKASKIKTHNATAKARVLKYCTTGWVNKSEITLDRTEILYLVELIVHRFPDFVFHERKMGKYLWGGILPSKFRKEYEKVPFKKSSSNRVNERIAHEFVTSYCSNKADCIELLKCVSDNWHFIRTMLLKNWNTIYFDNDGKQELFNLEQKCDAYIKKIDEEHVSHSKKRKT